MENKNDFGLPQRIIAVQNQLKIAIQNYQLMLQRKQLLRHRDEKIVHHLDILQFIIINIGRVQTFLLDQYRKEVAAKYNLKPTDDIVTNTMKCTLNFPPVPKIKPVLERPTSVLKVNKEGNNSTNKDLNNEINTNFNKKITKDASNEINKDANKDINKSLNKDVNKGLNKAVNKGSYKDVNKETNRDVNKETSKDVNKETNKEVSKDTNKEGNKDSNGNNKNKSNNLRLNGTSFDLSKLKAVYNNKRKENTKQIGPPAKKFHSILKPKIVEPKIDSDDKSSEEESSSSASDSSMSDDSKDKSSRAQSPNATDKIDLTYSPPPSAKGDNRYGRKYEGKLLGSSRTPCKPNVTSPAVKRSGNEVDQEDENQDEDVWVPFPAIAQAIKKIQPPKIPEENPPTSIDQMDQETYLAIFGLISIPKSEVVKKKKTERKRRSLAGTNSQYSDYYQPQLRRTYGPRKPAVPAIPIPTSPNNSVIVESSTGDDDDDEEKDKAVCLICHEGVENGALETCATCNENFHFLCLPADQKENCPSPTCMGQKNISNMIVGDSLPSVNLDGEQIEVVNRYLSDDLNQVVPDQDVVSS